MQVIEARHPRKLQLSIITAGVLFKYVLFGVLQNDGSLPDLVIGWPRVLGAFVIAVAVVVIDMVILKSAPPKRTNRVRRYVVWFWLGMSFESVLGDVGLL